MKKNLAASPMDIARWMLAQLNVKKDLFQLDVAADIYRIFGAKFTYINQNGNRAIDPQVLREFRKLTEGKVVWNRAERYWRKRTSGDPRKSRAVDY